MPISADRVGLVKQATTRKEMAQGLGLTHETFYRRLAGLEKKGVLRRDRGQIILLHPKS
jgi:CRP-like cAMP-binding protein